jgi:ABC-type branched-subunit amino acid transport system substrate-binding protein
MRPTFIHTLLRNFLAIFLGFGAAADSSLVSAQSLFKIGVSLPLSGGSANEGSDLKNMILFANKHLFQGKYSFLFEDDQCSDRQAVSIAHKFVDINRVPFVLGFACSGAVIASAPVYEKGKIVTIALATGAPAISGLGSYIFRTIPSLTVAAQKLFRQASSQFKTIGVLAEQTAYSQGLADAFQNENRGNSLKIVREDYLPETNDFRAILTKLRAGGVQALFLNPQSEVGMIELYRQLLTLNWKVQVFGAYYPGFSSFLKTFGGQADGIVYADLPFLNDTLDSEGKTLFEAFKAEYGSPQSSEFYFVTAVAAMWALHQTLITASPLPPNVYLHSAPFVSPVGAFSFNSKGDVQGEQLTFVLKRIDHGRPAPVIPGAHQS